MGLLWIISIVVVIVGCGYVYYRYSAQTTSVIDQTANVVNTVINDAKQAGNTINNVINSVKKSSNT